MLYFIVFGYWRFSQSRKSLLPVNCRSFCHYTDDPQTGENMYVLPNVSIPFYTGIHDESDMYCHLEDL